MMGDGFLVIIKGARFACFLGYNPFRICMKLVFWHTHCKVLEMTFAYLCWIHSHNDWQICENRCALRLERPWWFNSKTGPGQTFTDSTRSEWDPVHGPKTCVNFIEIVSYEPVISFPAIYDWLEYSPTTDRSSRVLHFKWLDLATGKKTKKIVWTSESIVHIYGWKLKAITRHLKREVSPLKSAARVKTSPQFIKCWQPI